MSAQSAAESNAPMACTLGPQDLQARFSKIRELASRALVSHEQVGLTLRLRYDAAVAAELERLVALEQDCCAFLHFDLQRQADAVDLHITAPAEAGDFAPLLYSHFIGDAPAAVAAQKTRPGSCACSSAASTCGVRSAEEGSP